MTTKLDWKAEGKRGEGRLDAEMRMRRWSLWGGVGEEACDD
jgi:hypothetical protein